MTKKPCCSDPSMHHVRRSLSIHRLFAVAMIAATLFGTGTVRASWIAYHDIAGTSHTAIPNTTSQATNNATTPLVQFADGSLTGVTVAISAGGWDGRGPTTTLPPAPGTLGDALFTASGLDLANGFIASRFDTQGAMTFTFTGLDPNKMYSVALYGNRNFATDGLDRFTLSNVDSATNVSSGLLSGLQANFRTRQNTVPPGESAYFKHIAPGADGTMLLTASGVAGSNIVYINGLRLAEQEPVSVFPIYRETFGNASASDQGLGYAGWVGYYGAGGTLLPDTGSPRGDISNLAGSSTSSGPINSDPNNNEPDNSVTATGFGRLLWPAGGGVSPALVYTEEFTVNRSLYNIEAFRWDQAINSSTDNFRVAVEIDGDWFVSDTQFFGPTNSGGSGAFGSNAWERALDFETAQWRSLAFTPGSLLGTPGSIVPLPGGDITAFGLYGSYNATMWFDTFTIEASVIIPEPGTYALGLLGAAGVSLLVRRRRKK